MGRVLKPGEWLLLAVLALITVAMMRLAPPAGFRDDGQALVQAPASATAVATPAPLTATAERPTSAVTPSGTSTPSVTRTATFAATASPSTPATATATPTPTATATPTVAPTATATPLPFNTHPEWARYLYVDQSTQMLYVFEHGALLRAIPCSTGKPENDKYTPAWSGRTGYYVGTFFSFDVWADDAWYLYQSAGAILIHSLPYTLQNGKKVYQDREYLGVRPSSHGCIRIAPEDCLWLNQWDPEGVPITVSDPYLSKWR